MSGKLNIVLQRIDSRLLSELWLFYRDYFQNDDACLNFIANAVRREPIYSEKEQMEKILRAADDKNYIDPDDRFFIPRRMLNCVERIVSAARDMDQIRRGKDIFKIIFLVTCVETLRKLSGEQDKRKVDLLFDFFERYTCKSDKEFICSHFRCEEDDTSSMDVSFWRFISVINEYRNCATHEGEYWDICFHNDRDKTPLLVIVKARLNKGAPKTENCYQTTDKVQ